MQFDFYIDYLNQSFFNQTRKTKITNELTSQYVPDCHEIKKLEFFLLSSTLYCTTITYS